MDGHLPPDLPPEIARTPIHPDGSGLSRLPLETSAAPAVEEAYAGPRTLDEWARESADAFDGTPRAVLVLRASPGHGFTAAAERVERAHAPEGGVAAGADELFLVLPEGVGWAMVAATAAGPGAEPFAAGLADAGVDGQSFADAVELARRAAREAVERGEALVLRSSRDDEDLRRAEAIESSLRAALEGGVELRLAYQPKYDVQSQEIVGAEALLRHRCDEYGEIPPMEFLGVAARVGLLTELQRWALGAAIDSVREWSEAGQLPFPISVNVATEDLFTDDFVASLGARIDAAGIDPALLRLEVPEAGVLADLDRATERLEELRALGVSLALDDFGGEDTPGVADLKRLPIDVLKVHRSFVLGMEAEPSLDALVRGVVTLAGALGIQTVAAGVETEAQLEHLAEYGCSAVQGFLLSPPLSRDAFEAKLVQIRCQDHRQR